MEPLSPFAPRPVEKPVMLQNWDQICFLHWRYCAASLQRLLPAGLTIDRYDSDAWLGLTPFVVQNLRPPFLPSLPWLSHFPETNVRTYVIGPDGARGIWFFTLEAARALAVMGARTFYGLPYRWASMSVRKQGSRMMYRSKRRGKSASASTQIVVDTGGEARVTEREIFLTARFRLYAYRGAHLWFADVEHEPWPLRDAKVSVLKQTLLKSLSLTETQDGPLVHYSPGVLSRIGRLTAV